jgi:hypothetical protein
MNAHSARVWGTASIACNALWDPALNEISPALNEIRQKNFVVQGKPGAAEAD